MCEPIKPAPPVTRTLAMEQSMVEPVASRVRAMGEDVPIYFVQKPFHRERQRDTPRHVPLPYRAVVPPLDVVVADHAANQARSAHWRGRAAALMARSPLPL